MKSFLLSAKILMWIKLNISTTESIYLVLITTKSLCSLYLQNHICKGSFTNYVCRYSAFLTPPPRVRSIWVSNHFRQVRCIRGYSIGPSLKWQFEIRRRAGSVRFEHLSKLDRWFVLEQNSGTFSLTTCNGLPFKAFLDVLRQTCQQHFGLDLPKSLTPSH